jgi:uncharacterized protein YciI
MRVLPALLIAIGCGLPAQAGAGVAGPAPQAAAPSPVPVLYVVHYRPGPAWKPGRPLSEQGLERHGAYMRDLAARGEILAAGPLSTIEGGLVILRADSLEAAITRMQADPAVEAGQFIGEVSVWRPGIDPAGRFSLSPDTPTP